MSAKKSGRGTNHTPAPSPQEHPALSPRKKQILKTVVEHYIRTAEPAGSRTIALRIGGVSPATIRNELAELTELGYLEQLHASAGRSPTPAGYRFYVDELMEQQLLSAQETERIREALRIRLEELDRVIARAGQEAAAFLNYPAYVTAAGKKKLTVLRYDLLPLDDTRCILVLMLNANRVHSRVIRTQLPPEPEQFPFLTGILNAHFVSLSADNMGRVLMDWTHQIPPPLFFLLSRIVSAACDVLEEQQRKTVTAGVQELLKLPEFRDAEKAHAIMSVLSDGKESLPAPEDESPMKILIGPENVTEALKDTSVVVASYEIGEEMRGLIGVVGPTRMDYATVAARLTGFAEGLTRLFGTQPLPPKEEEPS